MKRLTLITILLFFASAFLLAQSTTTPKINKKQKNQITKIEQGVKSGELTKHETKKLAQQEAKLQIHKKIAKSDGKVTAKERKELNKEARRLDAKIYKQKHDKQKRN